MKKGKLLIIIGAAVVVVIIGVVAAIFLMSGEPKPKEIVYSEYLLDEAYSNLLTDGNKKSIVKYKVCIQYVEDPETLKLLDKNKIKLMNDIDEIMRNTTLTDIEQPNGKEKLRVKIQNKVMDSLSVDDTVVTDIFINPFVVQ